jgi:hypothetical protein
MFRATPVIIALPGIRLPVILLELRILIPEVSPNSSGYQPSMSTGEYIGFQKEYPMKKRLSMNL